MFTKNIICFDLKNDMILRLKSNQTYLIKNRLNVFIFVIIIV